MVTLILRVLAEAGASTGGFDLAVFAPYGVVGAIATAGVLFARNAYAKAAATADAAYLREQERADRLEEENRKLNALIIDRVIPIVGVASRAVEQVSDLLTDAQREREQVRLLAQLRQEKQG